MRDAYDGATEVGPREGIRAAWITDTLPGRRFRRLDGTSGEVAVVLTAPLADSGFHCAVLLRVRDTEGTERTLRLSPEYEAMRATFSSEVHTVLVHIDATEAPSS
jgi:hypothetical protein